MYWEGNETQVSPIRAGLTLRVAGKHGRERKT